MDGNDDIRSQVNLMRAVIGRKIMEIDALDDSAASATGEAAERCMDMIDFLKNDISGYKSIIEDLKDGSNDLTGNLWDIASLPEKALGLYTDAYLPSLSEEDREEEDRAMEIKTKYAVDLAKAYVMHIARVALTDPRVVDMMLANEDLVSLIGAAIMDQPELMNALEL